MQNEPKGKSPDTAKMRPPWLALIGAAAAGVIAVLGWNVEASLFGLLSGVVYGAGAIGALVWKVLVRHSDRSWKSWLLGMLLWLVVILASTSLSRLRDVTALSRAQDIRVALIDYRRQQHRYPDSLEDLVPRYLSKIPLAKQTFLSQRTFRYRYRVCPESCSAGCDIFECLDPGSETATTATTAAGISFTHGVLDQTTLDVVTGRARIESY
ncbi:MAG: hypothetical protein HY791_28455 [Deltaproteobacteria bacterium]|nr:hypothetical protein [Deltaproteobacteria bacterium]